MLHVSLRGETNVVVVKEVTILIVDFHKKLLMLSVFMYMLQLAVRDLNANAEGSRTLGGIELTSRYSLHVCLY